MKTLEGEDFTGELVPPVFQDLLVAEQKINGNIISVIEVGNQNEHIQFEDGSGNALNVTVRMPVPGKEIGEQIDIYSSEDSVNFVYLTTVTVQEIDGESYVVFLTNHFSVFVTAMTNGTNISADKAGNASSSGWTTLNDLTIAEGSVSDFAVGTSRTLIITAPSNWRFKAGV